MYQPCPGRGVWCAKVQASIHSAGAYGSFYYESRAVPDMIPVYKSKSQGYAKHWAICYPLNLGGSREVGVKGYRELQVEGSYKTCLGGMEGVISKGAT